MSERKSRKQSKIEIGNKEAAINTLKNLYPDITDKREVKPVDPATCLPSPSPSVNIATNEQGFRPGSIVEWYGLEGTVKTTFALEMARQAQIKWPDKSVAYIDTEQAVDLYVAEHNYGVDMGYHANGFPKFDYYPDPERHGIPTLEDVLNRVYNCAASGLYSIIIIDSIAASITLWEQEQDDITDAKWGGPSIQMSKAMKKIKAVCARTGTVIWCINQVRWTNSGPNMPARQEPGGGLALRFAATHRFKVSWVAKVQDKDEQVLHIKTDKIKYGRPWTTLEVPYILGKGVDREADIILLAERHGIITKSTSWYSYKETRLGQGSANAGEFLRQHPELAIEIERAIYAKVKPNE